MKFCGNVSHTPIKPGTLVRTLKTHSNKVCRPITSKNEVKKGQNGVKCTGQFLKTGWEYNIRDIYCEKVQFKRNSTVQKAIG